MVVSLFLYGLIVVALLIAELREDRRAQFFFKPLAAFGFVVLALQFGAFESLYGKFILGGLIACAAGDVFLLSRKSQGLFISGMVAFAAGHIIFSFGFMKHGFEYDAAMNGKSIFGMAIILGMLCLVGAVYIIPRAAREMRIPIIIYSIIITTMCVLAVLTDNIIIIIAALAFATSDYFVGTDRFLDPKKYWSLLITPLYFGAQALFALSVSI